MVLQILTRLPCLQNQVICIRKISQSSNNLQHSDMYAVWNTLHNIGLTPSEVLYECRVLAWEALECLSLIDVSHVRTGTFWKGIFSCVRPKILKLCWIPLQSTRGLVCIGTIFLLGVRLSLSGIVQSQPSMVILIYQKNICRFQITIFIALVSIKIFLTFYE